MPKQKQKKLFGIQLSNPYHYTREKVHTVKSAVNVITSMVDMQVTAQEIQKHEEKGTLNEDMRAQFETDAAAKSNCAAHVLFMRFP